jgi:RimJ/RimL family protein N-acetyltransferase
VNLWAPILVGPTVTLRPVTAADWTALYAAASDPLIWEQHPEPTRWQAPVFRAFFEGALAADGGLVVLDSHSGAVIGSSRFHAHDAARREVEIGWTFLTRAYWGGATNREMKALMLAHAFLHVDRVIFKVGPNNLRSQRALAKIGAYRASGADPAADGMSLVFELRRQNFAP